MKIVIAKCNDCNHEQEDLINRTTEPEFEPCQKCGSTNMAEATGDIRPFSCQNVDNPGIGPWG